MNASIETIADSPAIAAARLGLCRATIYSLISSGALTARKLGRRTLIERTEQLRWLTSLPVMGAAA